MADSKVSALPTIGTLDSTDYIYLVDDTAGTPASRKATVATLEATLQTDFRLWNVVRAASDQDVASNTTPVDDNELRFDMDAGGLYTWYIYLAYSSPAGGGTPDLKWAFAGPATLTGCYVLFADYLSTADGLGTAQSSIALTSTNSVGTAATPRLMTSHGWCSSSGGGTGASGFRFQFSQNTSGINATRRLAGSLLYYKKLA